ncbi:Hypothetical predicted protein, partial [Paramuricea clavata]
LPFLTKAKVFTIADASEAFHKVVLYEHTSLLTTFQGPNGRYRYLRMLFGISSGPEEYQRRQQEFLEGLEDVINIADDICIFGCGDTDEQASKDHNTNLIALLDRCSERDLRLSPKKIQFKATSVSFMGHILTDKGVALDPSKVIVIQEMPKPVDRNGVQRFLGMCQYLSKFCPKLSKIVLPLRDLTRLNVEFIWTDVHESAFNSAKDLIASSTILQYYDVTLPVTLQVDASNEAIGGVLLQNGKSVCFTSHTLDSTERNYAQIEKECLAIVTCMSKCHQYLYGKKNILVHTDHQPQETIFRKPLSKAPRRLQRMMLKLQQYHFSVQYKKGKEMYIADTLSRAALTNPTAMGTSEEERLKEEVSSDATLKSLYETVLIGWPDEISIDNGVLLKSHQVIIPPSMRQEMLNKIHKAHQGMSAAIRQTCLSCGLCAQYKSERPTEPMKSQEIPTLPWERISVDLFQLDFKTYLNTSATAVINAMKRTLPEQEFLVHASGTMVHSKGNGKAESAGHTFSPAQRLMNRKLRDITVSVPQQLKPHPVSSTEVVNDILSRRVRSKQQRNLTIINSITYGNNRGTIRRKIIYDFFIRGKVLENNKAILTMSCVEDAAKSVLRRPVFGMQ